MKETGGLYGASSMCPFELHSERYRPHRRLHHEGGMSLQALSFMRTIQL